MQYTALITTAAGDIQKYFLLFFFSEKIRLDASSESAARQRILIKNQALFSSKDKSKKFICRLLQFLFGALRVNMYVKEYIFTLFPYNVSIISVGSFTPLVSQHLGTVSLKQTLHDDDFKFLSDNGVYRAH